MLQDINAREEQQGFILFDFNFLCLTCSSV